MSARVLRQIPKAPVSQFLRTCRTISIAKNWIEYQPVFLDTETTGLRESDEIIEIGIINLQGEVLLNTLVKPSIAIPAEATAIHHISDAMVADAPTMAELLPKLQGILATSRLVCAYNMAFDFSMVQRAFHRADRFTAFPSWACVMQLYAYYYGDWSRAYDQFRWQKLVDAARRHDLSATVEGAQHRALYDADLCRQLLMYLSNMPVPSSEDSDQ